MTHRQSKWFAALLAICLALGGWALYTADDLKADAAAQKGSNAELWKAQAEKHLVLDRFVEQTNSNIASIDITLQEIKDEIVLLRHDLGLKGVRNSVSDAGKQ